MSKFALTAILAGTLALSAAAAQAEIKLIANEPGPNRGVRAKAVEYIAEQIGERTGGAVTVEQNWGGALFKANTALTSITNGVADLGLIIGSYHQSEFPELAMGDLPFENADPWVMMMAMADMFTNNAQIQSRLEELNLVYVAPFATSQGMLGCKGPSIQKVEDFKGVKTRYAGAFGEIFSNLGGNMVDMSIYEAFQGMETGLLECTLNYPYFAVATKMDDLLTSITKMNFSGSSSLGTFMNKDTFDSLSAEQQAAVKGLRDDVVNFYSERLFVADDKAWVTMIEEKKIPVYELSAEDYAKMDEAAKPMMDKWKANATDKGFDADALLAEMQATIAKYNEIKATQGYPWTRK